MALCVHVCMTANLALANLKSSSFLRSEIVIVLELELVLGSVFPTSERKNGPCFGPSVSFRSSHAQGHSDRHREPTSKFHSIHPTFPFELNFQQEKRTLPAANQDPAITNATDGPNVAG